VLTNADWSKDAGFRGSRYSARADGVLRHHDIGGLRNVVDCCHPLIAGHMDPIYLGCLGSKLKYRLHRV
jgi:hypothetical protein